MAARLKDGCQAGGGLTCMGRRLPDLGRKATRLQWRGLLVTRLGRGTSRLEGAAIQVGSGLPGWEGGLPGWGKEG
jgi:hypothetical protein